MLIWILFPCCLFHPVGISIYKGIESRNSKCAIVFKFFVFTKFCLHEFSVLHELPDTIALEPEPPWPWWWVLKGLCLLCYSPGKAVWNLEGDIKSRYVQRIGRSEASEKVLLSFTSAFLHHKVTYLLSTVTLKGFPEAVLICAGAVKPLEVILVCIKLLDKVYKFFVGVLQFFHLPVQFLLAEAVFADLPCPLSEYLDLLPVKFF